MQKIAPARDKLMVVSLPAVRQLFCYYPVQLAKRRYVIGYDYSIGSCIECGTGFYRKQGQIVTYARFSDAQRLCAVLNSRLESGLTFSSH